MYYRYISLFNIIYEGNDNVLYCLLNKFILYIGY